jgi:hypothetical protein
MLGGWSHATARAAHSPQQGSDRFLRRTSRSCSMVVRPAPKHVIIWMEVTTPKFASLHSSLEAGRSYMPQSITLKTIRGRR